MPYMLRAATAGQEVPLGPFLDETDGKTAETGLTVQKQDVKLHKTGATTLADMNGTGTDQALFHISNGIYYATLDATDTNTYGPLVIFIHKSGALPVRLECEVVDTNTWNARYNGNENLNVNIVKISGDATAADNAEAFFDGTGYAGTNNVMPTVTTVNGLGANTITASSIASDAITSAKIQDGAITAAKIATDAIGANQLAAGAVTEIQSGLSTLSAADVRTAVGLASANLDTQLSSIQSDTNDIQTRLPAALVSGRMDCSVGAMAANVVTSSAIATDAIGASQIAAAAVSEIQSGLSTLTAAQVWSAANIVDTLTPAQVLMGMISILAGKVTGAGTGTEVFKGPDGSTTRVTVTVDNDGNRSTVVLNL